MITRHPDDTGEINTDKHTQELTPELFEGVPTVRTWSAAENLLKDAKPGARIIVEAINTKLRRHEFRDKTGSLDADRIVLAVAAELRINVRAIILHAPGPEDSRLDFKFGLMKDSVNPEPTSE